MKTEEYFLHQVPGILGRLKKDTLPEWGSLTAQHMVEHLVSTWRISNGKSNAPLLTPEEKLPGYRDFLYSDKPFERHIKNRLMGESLPELRKPSLEAAIDQLTMEIRDFFSFYKDKPSHESIHPFFGKLDKNGWLAFQEKHLDHHFKQFGLI